MQERVKTASEFILEQSTYRPKVALVLGSGLGGFVDALPQGQVLEYEDIPGFPVSGVEGHAGRMVLTRIEGMDIAVMQGRVHYYEGYDMAETVIPVRVLHQIGVTHLILTNAAGAINADFLPGDFVRITDHINLTGQNPLIGPNDADFGPRFPDMSNAYDPVLGERLARVAGETGIILMQGVYAMMTGPSFETPAEIRALRTLGADLVGMSTVPEVIAASHCGMKAAAISCATNMAAGVLEQPLSHDEVMETGARVSKMFEKLLLNVLISLSKYPLAG